MARDEQGEALDPDLLRAIVSGTSDAVFVKDRDGRYVYVNAAAANILGLTVGEVIGRRDAELLPPDVAASIEAIDQRVLATGVSELFEERNLVADQPSLWSTKKFVYRDKDGRVAGVVGVARDITERARVEAALAEREALLRQVIDALPVGVFVIGADGDIVMSNRMTARIWGRAIQSGGERWKLSLAWWHGTRVQVKPHEWASVRALTEGIEVLDQIVDIEAFDGVKRTIRNAAVPIVGPAGIAGAVVLNEDITERLQLQTNLAQAQKMEAIGQLASGVAHDFNNMLMVIYAYAQMVLDTFEEGDPRRLDLEELRKAAESASSLTRQLLAFGRRDLNQPRTVTLETVVSETQKLLGRVLGEHITVVTRLAEPPNEVWIDPRQLEQVLLNLAVNARDAMADGGELSITTQTVAARSVAVLTVRDHGSGMDEATLARIFEPFFTTKERGHGTGLGLATVHGIIEQNGGTIRVSSVLGSGTTFEIELPLSQTRRAPAVTAPLTAAGARGTESVLLVEDSPPVRLAVRAMLEKLGYRVHDVADAAAALAYVNGGAAVDLLITDVVLTGANGRALADELVKNRPQLRVLFISGYADDAELRSSDRQILAKPFSSEELARTVRAVLAT